MSEVLKYNLFHLAPHEMSHSAFWGWVIQCVDSSAPDRLAEVKQLGERLLTQLRVPPLPPRFNVRTEVLLGKRKGRLDILVTDPSGKRILVIETKISADPDTLQLDKYRAFLGPDVPIRLVSTRLDNPAVD